MTGYFPHQTVLLHEAVAALQVQPMGTYVDGTFGRGGHSRMLLSQLGAQGRLLAVDKDPAAVAHAQAEFGQEPRIYIYKASFAQLGELVDRLGWRGQLNGVLLDLGVSSPQLDDPQRGFSFRHSGPLDMRMDADNGMSAAAWLAQASEAEIAEVIFHYGEERYARRIARAIIAARQQSPIDTTQRLAAVVATAVPTRERNKDPATRSFMAIRIFINRELDELRQCLAQLHDLLAPGGRVVVISFHSLEDRIVKRFMRDMSRGEQFPLDLPITHVQENPKWRLVGKPIKPSDTEIHANARARSAILRVAEKLA
ncbi:MAG: 16S rRNA (cytosine(1402)-N(4))-methyltransferase RsmH [Gammaproteobacteria bacterium]|nr:16S rRNA (cytosine(1402)-N(4))-methyltransferase RsmH [Gammaproteobacteria bacterium]